PAWGPEPAEMAGDDGLVMTGGVSWRMLGERRGRQADRRSLHGAGGQGKAQRLKGKAEEKIGKDQARCAGGCDARRGAGQGRRPQRRSASSSVAQSRAELTIRVLAALVIVLAGCSSSIRPGTTDHSSTAAAVGSRLPASCRA